MWLVWDCQHDKEEDGGGLCFAELQILAATPPVLLSLPPLPIPSFLPPLPSSLAGQIDSWRKAT